MKNFSLINRIKQIIIISILIIIFNQCKNAKKSKIIYHYKCKIESSSSNPATFLLDSANTWISNNPAKNDLIVINLDSTYYIHHIKIKQDTSIRNKITKVKIYTDKGLIDNSNPDSIFINKKIFKIYIKIQETKNFNFTKFYNNSNSYLIATNLQNEFSGIKNIEFFYDDSTKIQIENVNNNDSTNTIVTEKLIDFSQNRLTFISKKNRVYLNEEAKTDTFWFGKISGEEIYLNKIFFTNDTIVKKEEKKLFIQRKNEIILGTKIINRDFPDNYFVDLQSLDSTIKKDIRYATTNNFMNEVLYPCDKCLLRYEAAKKLVEAQKEFQKLGYCIKVFDCYRPLSVQIKMWEMLPNKNFVANPEIGSMHNRGLAIDMTLLDSTGTELDMGTEYDFFGHKAYSIDTNQTPEVLKNRRFLWKTMHKYGFWEIRTEWWHFSYRINMHYPLDNTPLPCD